MGYARYVGRVGALAVTLGVGLAMANTPGIAYAQPSGSSSAATDSSSTGKSSPTTRKSSTGADKESSGSDTASKGSEGAAPPDSDPKSPAGSAESSPNDTGDDGEDAAEGDDVEETNKGRGDQDALSADTGGPRDDVTVQDSASNDSADQRLSSGHSAHVVVPHVSDAVEPSVTSAVEHSSRPGGTRPQMRITNAVAGPPTQSLSANISTNAVTTPATASTTSAAATTSAPSEPPQPSTMVNVVSDLVAAVLQPLMSPGTGSPLPASLLVGLLSAVRNEIERMLFRRTAPVASQYSVTQLDPTPDSELADPAPNVLLIGVDGTNLSRILADDENDNFFALMNDGTTGASSIVGHTTISNPSWTAILTGVWSEKAGVINNVFTPWTYDKWPTVFNQLETHDANIETTTIADWNVVNAISGAGSIPVDTNIYIPRFEGDTDWSQTDDAVGEATVDAIDNTSEGVPTFLFSYFVGVDENGHMHGGASPEYAAAIRNVDENLGDILAAVQAWETAHPDEGEWTIIVVTDHGHQPQQGFGHGFQTPDETATFVIASGPDFNEGWVNPEYEIVDTTPTVLALFGAPPPADADGVSLMTLAGSDEGPGPGNLHQALQEMIATNQSPDIVTDLALSLRTIFATIPYYVWTLTNDGTLPSPIGEVLYVVTNIPAQIVARLTGVTGARIFPLLPPGPPSWPGQEATETDTVVLACGGDTSGSAAGLCDAGIVA